MLRQLIDKHVEDFVELIVLIIVVCFFGSIPLYFVLWFIETVIGHILGVPSCGDEG